MFSDEIRHNDCNQVHGEGSIIRSKDKSIEELCAATWESLYRFIYYKVQNREEAEDITQETYVKAISYIQRHNATIEKHLAFLKTVSLNILKDKWRKKKRHGTPIDFDEISPEKTALADPTGTLAEREWIENALKLLKKEHRDVITYRILKGYSLAETAKLMNRKENNISVLQYRAIQHLTKIMKQMN